MSNFFNDSIFWVEVDRISPNPFQPRREFDALKLQELADSIRMYGVLQPLVVTRKEVQRADGSFTSEYELLSGERRLRASKLAGLSQVPVLIRDQEQSDKQKLEIAIIENLQREDLNVVERAKAFKQLADEFGMRHADIGKKVGRSRVYVTNSIRILGLPEDMILALGDGRITEGHTRPLLMLIDRPAEQSNLFREIMQKKMSVRDAEGISRRIAYERAKKHDRMLDPEICELEDKFKETLGTRVYIEKRQTGGKLSIDFFTMEDLRGILDLLDKNKIDVSGFVGNSNSPDLPSEQAEIGEEQESDENVNEDTPLDDRSKEERTEAEENEDDLYSIQNFTV